MAPAGSDAPAKRKPMGCGGLVGFFIKLPFMIIAMIRHLGPLLRQQAATDTGRRAREGGEQLTPAQDPAAVTAGLAAVASRDPGFDVAVTVRGVQRARAVVEQARRTGDTSAARQVLSEGLWRLFVMLLAGRADHEVRRYETSAVAGAAVVAATRDQLSEQLRIRLTCRGERYEVAETPRVRGQPGQQEWLEDWVVRRAAAATTPPGGGILDGRCPRCGATLEVSPDGSCAYCKALVLTGGEDWVVWSIEEAPW